MPKKCISIIFALAGVACISAQQQDAQQDPAAPVISDSGDAEAASVELLPEATRDALEPIFPDESTALIAVEAEDAVSTNFAKEPTLN